MKIRIPVPCHEDWNKMTPSEQGRHCASCNKTVVDFTVLSDRQIIQHLQQNSATCGRFSNDQLNRDLVLDPSPPKSYGFWKLAACVVLSVNLLDGMAIHTPRNFVERHDLPKIELNDSIPLPFNGRLKFKINAAPEHLDSLRNVQIQLNSFQMVFDDIVNNQTYEFHVPDSVLWDKIEIMMVSKDSASTNIELTKEEWLEQYQNNDKELLIEFVDFWTIKRFELKAVDEPKEVFVESIKTPFIWYGNFAFGMCSPISILEIADDLQPKTELHPPVSSSSLEQNLLDKHSDEFEIYKHKPRPTEQKRNFWKTFYYSMLAGIVGFLTVWTYKRRHKLIDSDESPSE